MVINEFSISKLSGCYYLGHNNVFFPVTCSLSTSWFVGCEEMFRRNTYIHVTYLCYFVLLVQCKSPVCLLRAGKIQESMFNSYENECKRIAAQLLEGIDLHLALHFGEPVFDVTHYSSVRNETRWISVHQDSHLPR
jgi:hypothetical protein